MLKNLIIGIAFFSGVAALVICLMNLDNKKQVYIDMGKVYSEFQLSKELNEQLDAVLKARKKIVDSLFEDIRLKTIELKEKPKQSLEEMSKLAKLEESYMYKQQQFEKENQTVNAEYTNKIWGQLNQYISDFGSENKYTFILGATGEGNIMYADKTFNITDEVVKYVNDRYNDKIKK